MRDSPPDPEFKSAERLAFEIYLRTGKRLAAPHAPERKFNPYHDPRNGRFTFAPGGPRSVGGGSGSDPRGVRAPKRKRNAEPKKVVDSSSGPNADLNPLSVLPTASQSGFQLANRGGGRGSRRGRGGRPPTDPTLLEHAFPGLSRSPAGAIVRMADGIADLTTAAQEATREIHRAQVRRLLTEIRDVDPDYKFESLGEPTTIDGRANQIKALRFDRAVAFYRERGEFRPLQVEVLRIMQETADSAYTEALERSERGLIRPTPTLRVAIGNYVDRAVKRELRQRFNVNRIDYSIGQPIRVQGREYFGLEDERRYKQPDARVHNIALDASIREKTLKDEQIQGFFNGDFRPDYVVIVRPSQLGGSYLIKRP